jgi:glycosyltransferase involved in cell wall biosynthesis
MRILQIHPLMKSEALAPAAGGMARAALQLTRLLLERGHDVQVLPIPEGVGSRELWEIAPGHAAEIAAAMHIPGWREMFWLPRALLRLRPLPAGIKNAFYDAFALTALHREVRIFRPEIIHNHLARRPFPRLARSLGLHGNLILTHHHGEAGEGLDAYDQLVFPSRAARERITSQIAFPKERTRSIHYPVSPVFCRAELSPGGPRKGVVYAGAVRRRKGIDLLLDAYRSDRSLWAEPLTVCGRGEDEALVDQAAREGVPIHRLGQLSAEQLAEALARARWAVIPSRLEGFSIAILEALCCGTPVIGWAPQISELEETLGCSAGKPFDGRIQSASGLAELLRTALREDQWTPDRRSSLADAARNKFSEERYVGAYLGLYRELIGS